MLENKMNSYHHDKIETKELSIVSFTVFSQLTLFFVRNLLELLFVTGASRTLKS